MYLLISNDEILPPIRLENKFAKQKERVESFPNPGKGMSQMSFLVF